MENRFAGRQFELRGDRGSCRQGALLEQARGMLLAALGNFQRRSNLFKIGRPDILLCHFCYSQGIMGRLLLECSEFEHHQTNFYLQSILSNSHLITTAEEFIMPCNKLIKLQQSYSTAVKAQREFQAMLAQKAIVARAIPKNIET